jgi:8-oxo-dGTP diphosphatase
MIDKLFVATKAFIEYDGQILIIKESSQYLEGANQGRYDVPGGRVEKGERWDEGFLREIKEETGLEVTLLRPFFRDEWRPEVRGEKWQIIGTYIHCSTKSNLVNLSDDHDEYLWIDPKEYKKYKLLNKAAFESFLELT